MRPRNIFFVLISVVLFCVLVSAPVFSQVSNAPAGTTATKPAAKLDQCRNGVSTSPVPCAGGAWVNGNAGASNAHYLEGESISYRMTMTGLSVGSHVLKVQWDTTKGGVHALDYLTSWDRSVHPGSEACNDVAGAVCTSPRLFAIPFSLDNAIPTTLAVETQQAYRSLTIYGGTIRDVSFSGFPSSYAGDTSQTTTITFDADQSVVVLAWGAHIAKRQEWGAPLLTALIPFTGTAANISGSPYHMRLISLDGGGGNQDRSLSAASVISPSQITIGKSITTAGATPSSAFQFTASPAPLSDFPLQPPDSLNQFFANIINFTTYTVAELAKTGWALDTSSYAQGIHCVLTTISLDYGKNIFTTNLATDGKSADVAIALGEGDDVTCTFYNKATTATLVVTKNVVNDNGGAAVPGDFTITVTAGHPSPASFPGSGTGTTVTLDAGSYSVSETAVTGYSATYSSDCTGTLAGAETKYCTVTNDDIAPKLTVNKTIHNNHGGSKLITDFTAKVDGSPVTWGDKHSLSAGAHVASEVSAPGYSASDWGGDCATNGSITLAVGDDKTCSITNSDIAPKLTLIKTVDNTGGGTKAVADFTLKVDATVVASGVAHEFNAGAHTASEVSLPGYNASVWGGDCAANGSITLALAEDKTCTITNTAIAPTLTVVKSVVNRYGGRLGPNDFSLKVNDVGVNSGDKHTSSVGTYTVTEVLPAGYTRTSWSSECPGGVVTLALGDNKTCTVTNTDLPPHLIVTKTPDKAGDVGYLRLPGEPAVFSITVQNSGSGIAYNVVLTDSLPSGVGDWTASPAAAAGDCTISAVAGSPSGTPKTELSCNVGNLAPSGGSFTVNLTATIPASYIFPPAWTGGGTQFYDADGDIEVFDDSDKDFKVSLIDCASTPKVGCDIDLPPGPHDNSFGQGTKEDIAVPTVVTGSVPNNKSDLTRFYVSTAKHLSSGTDYLYLAWERVQAPKGTTNMDFELNQSANLSSNNVTPARTAGDLLITYDLESGGTVPTLAYHVWVTALSATGSAADTCAAANAFPCWDKAHALTDNVEAAINTLSIEDPILESGQTSPRNLDPLTFGEAVVDLQAIGIFPTTVTSLAQCTSFGQAYLKSRSSSSFNTEIKDFIKPIPITVSNCPPKLLNNTASAVDQLNAPASDTGKIEVAPDR